MRRVRVLLVDDHVGFLDTMTGYLAEQLDVEIVGEARSGQEALTQVDQLGPDLVLLDWNMPGLSGLQTLAALKKRPLPPRVVMLTSHDHRRYREAAQRHGADGFVVKKDMDTQLVPLLEDLFRLT